VYGGQIVDSETASFVFSEDPYARDTERSFASIHCCYPHVHSALAYALIALSFHYFCYLFQFRSSKMQWQTRSKHVLIFCIYGGLTSESCFCAVFSFWHFYKKTTHRLLSYWCKLDKCSKLLDTGGPLLIMLLWHSNDPSQLCVTFLPVNAVNTSKSS